MGYAEQSTPHSTRGNRGPEAFGSRGFPSASRPASSGKTRSFHTRSHSCEKSRTHATVNTSDAARTAGTSTVKPMDSYCRRPGKKCVSVCTRYSYGRLVMTSGMVDVADFAASAAASRRSPTTADAVFGPDEAAAWTRGGGRARRARERARRDRRVGRTDHGRSAAGCAPGAPRIASPPGSGEKVTERRVGCGRQVMPGKTRARAILARRPGRARPGSRRAEPRAARAPERGGPGREREPAAPASALGARGALPERQARAGKIWVVEARRGNLGASDSAFHATSGETDGRRGEKSPDPRRAARTAAHSDAQAAVSERTPRAATGRRIPLPNLRARARSLDRALRVVLPRRPPPPDPRC